MTDQSSAHPTSGRRRRPTSPPILHEVVAWPVPRLADHLDDTEHGLSGDEGEKDAKRQRSEPTTPNEYDEVMGITQVDPREAERIEEGLDLEYHDASEDLQNCETSSQNNRRLLIFPKGVVVVHHSVNALSC